MADADDDFTVTVKGKTIPLPQSGIVTTVEHVPIVGPGFIESPVVPLKWAAELMQMTTVRVEHGAILTLILWTVRRVEE